MYGKVMMESVEEARVGKQVCGGERWWKMCVNEVTEGKKSTTTTK